MILTSRLAIRCLIFFFLKQFWWKRVSFDGNLIQPKLFGLKKWTETVPQPTGDLTRSSQVGTGQIIYWVLDHHQELTNTNIKNLLNPTKIKFQYFKLNTIISTLRLIRTMRFWIFQWYQNTIDNYNLMAHTNLLTSDKNCHSMIYYVHIIFQILIYFNN